MCSLSADPPSLLACINRDTRAYTEISSRGKFGVNLLSVAQRPIADHCSRAGTHKALRDSWLALDEPTETPRLRNSLAQLECDVDRTYVAYSHSVFVGLIRSVWLNPRNAAPLLYHGGVYGQLESATERAERFHWELPDE
jgi:flavin reductase (DIM6/NTAB) family NADH-FMN oxidoreductase RutF